MDTVIFEGPPPTVQKLWPSHCIQGSWGSELHTELKVQIIDVKILSDRYCNIITK